MINGLVGEQLTDADFAALEGRWITRELAEGAFLRRVESAAGAELIGQSGRAGDYAGIVIPYTWPGEASVREFRLRRDHPDMQAGSDGRLRPTRKYLSPPGRGNLLYIPPQVHSAFLADCKIPLVVVEGEFKCLALWRLAWHGLGDVAESPAFLPVGLQGVWNWRGTIGKAQDSGGARVDVRGPIPDLSKIQWEARRVVIVFDADVATNDSVRRARVDLTHELQSRGASVAIFAWPRSVPEEQKGIDDFLAANGPDPVTHLLLRAKVARSKRRRVVSVTEAAHGDDWQQALICGDRGIRPILANAMLALRRASAWRGVLAFNEFSQRTEVVGGSPWRNEDYLWADVDDIRLAEWMQINKIEVTRDVAAQAVEAVSREQGYHPVRDYLDSLVWDRMPRIDQWLTTYLGADATRYVSAVGAKWLISAVARIVQPGCQADHTLILQGVQGLGKSTALRIIGGEWFTDHIDNLGSKDSLVQLLGVWIVEFGELSQLVSRLSEIEAVKTFLTRPIDHFRTPYGRRASDFPRQCVFSGSSNNDTYFRDETGGRRFWPVTVKEADAAALARDRDQLLAEARARYDLGEKWWIPKEDTELQADAEEEQDKRYQRDPWDAPVWEFVVGARSGWEAGGKPLAGFKVTVAELLREAVKKDLDQWSRQDSNRIIAIMRHRGMEYVRERLYSDVTGEALRDPDGKPRREYHFRWPGEAPSS